MLIPSPIMIMHTTPPNTNYSMSSHRIIIAN